MAAEEAAKNLPAETGITSGDGSSEPSTTTTTTITATSLLPTTEAKKNTPATKVTKTATRRIPKEDGRGKGKATSTKENAKLRGKEISNRFTLPDTVPADVGDPSDLVAMADSNDFNVRVRDRMPSQREIVQLSQEQGVHYNVAFAQEQEKAKVVEHALTDMAGSFPSLPPSDMLETATITAVVDDAAPTPMESPPTAAPSMPVR